MKHHVQQRSVTEHRTGCRRLWGLGLAVLMLWLALPSAPAALKQFDCFVGFDSIVPEGNWFPMSFEVLNEGTTFEALVEIEPAQFSRGQVRQMRVELPTGTRKRFAVPMFGSSMGQSGWNITVRDANGAKRDELLDVRPRKVANLQAPIIGALARSVGGLPVLPDVERNYSAMQPYVARLSPELFPDNPLALEGLSALYLNAEKAQELKDNQVRALQAWLAQGGHLIVGLHSPSDMQASPWLRDLSPFVPAGQENMACALVLNQWLSEPGTDALMPFAHAITNQITSREFLHPGFRCLSGDAAFYAAQCAVVTGRARNGRVMLAQGQHPLIVESQRVRGRVTVLAFSPETEPFRSWVNRRYFWAKLTDLPARWFERPTPGNNPNTQQPYYSSYYGDAVFGAITDSKQIRKLPAGWLLLLLLSYLAVIGPLDYFVLKRMKRQMLTWLTFPAYVLMFSGLIYLIGYKLRAGDVEWNEFHVVDVLPRNDGAAALRGRVYAGIYSPVNARYQVASTNAWAAFRDEYSSYYGGSGAGAGRTVVQQRGNQFAAEVAVPVWTSQLYVEDYWQPAKTAPLSVEITRQTNRWHIKIQNHLPHELERVAVMVEGRLHETNGVAAGDSRTLVIAPSQGEWINNLISSYRDRFASAANSRRSALGANENVAPGEKEYLRWTAAASFQELNNQPYNRFRFPPSFDLSPSLLQGQVIVFAWLPNRTLVPALNEKQFSPRRSNFDTVLRLTAPKPE